MKFIYSSISERERYIDNKRKQLARFSELYLSKEFEPGREGQILEALEALTRELRECVDGVVEEPKN